MQSFLVVIKRSNGEKKEKKKSLDLFQLVSGFLQTGLVLVVAETTFPALENILSDGIGHYKVKATTICVSQIGPFCTTAHWF